MLAMMSANLIGGIICLVIGLILRTGKANFLIAGFNTMNKEEKAKWNEKAVSRFTSWLLIIPSAVLLIGCIPILFNVYPVVFILISHIIFTVLIVLGVIYMNTSPRFKRVE